MLSKLCDLFADVSLPNYRTSSVLVEWGLLSIYIPVAYSVSGAGSGHSGSWVGTFTVRWFGVLFAF